ncbi:hypothetical protein TorRG33x02_190990, partial [Trema orientale]
LRFNIAQSFQFSCLDFSHKPPLRFNIAQIF